VLTALEAQVNFEMNKIVVVNGKFYAGKDADNKLILKDKRSEAVVIKDLDEFKVVVGAILCRMMSDQFELKRVEVLDVGSRDNSTAENPLGSIS